MGQHVGFDPVALQTNDDDLGATVRIGDDVVARRVQLHMVELHRPPAIGAGRSVSLFARGDHGPVYIIIGALAGL